MPHHHSSLLGHPACLQLYTINRDFTIYSMSALNLKDMKKNVELITDRIVTSQLGDYEGQNGHKSIDFQTRNWLVY